MTDLAAALADNSKLGEFEGEKVLSAGIELPDAAGGLREALAIEPQAFHDDGSKRFVVLEVGLEKIRFDPIRDGKEGAKLGWRRVHVFKTSGATFVDADLVKSHIDQQRERIQRAKDQATGQGSLSTELLESQHADGRHADGLVEGCPRCEEEQALEEEEQSAKS